MINKVGIRTSYTLNKPAFSARKEVPMAWEVPIPREKIYTKLPYKLMSDFLTAYKDKETETVKLPDGSSILFYFRNQKTPVFPGYKKSEKFCGLCANKGNLFYLFNIKMPTFLEKSFRLIETSILSEKPPVPRHCEPPTQVLEAVLKTALVAKGKITP
jgi:hypothetical protein